MARIAYLVLSFILVACATSKNNKDEEILDVDMRNNLFSTQNNFENIISQKDELFFSMENSSCLNNWVKGVKKYKDRLKKTTKNKVRADSWFHLGNCYNYVNQYNLALYYYDLFISSGVKDNQKYATMYFNMGQIYEKKRQIKLAFSYYKNSLNYGDATKLSLFKLGMLSFKENEFNKSNTYFKQLGKFFPKSSMVKFLVGVNYFHLNSKELLHNKVIKRMDEKSVGRIMLSMASDLAIGKNKEKLETDLKNLDVTFSLHKQFKSYLLRNFGR